jgi:hypothetical protein
MADKARLVPRPMLGRRHARGFTLGANILCQDLLVNEFGHLDRD